MAKILREYSFGQKNNWRRRVWNRVAAAAGTEPRVVSPSGSTRYFGGQFPRVADMRVLFMPGPSCEDIPVAVSKGFRKTNLVAVDLDEVACRRARKAGVLAVRGELGAVLLALGPDDAFDVVVADLCTNWSQLLYSIIQCVIFSRARRAPLYLVVNILRGRETRKHADILRHYEMQHRGYAVQLMLHGLLAKAGIADADVPKYFARAWTDSYRSSMQYMDSIGLMLNLPESDVTVGGQLAELRATACRSIAAARAVHTMQMG